MLLLIPITGFGRGCQVVSGMESIRHGAGLVLSRAEASTWHPAVTLRTGGNKYTSPALRWDLNQNK